MVHVSRGGWVLTTLSGVSAAAIAPDSAELAGSLTGPSFPDALVSVASLALLATSVGVLAVVALSTVGRTSRLAQSLTPHLVRRALFTGAAGAMVLSPTHASTVSSEEGVSPPHHSVSGLRLPDRPTAAPPAGGVPVSPPTTQVLVRPGDTLWAIASRGLPDDAPDADKARACDAWHTANRDVIGDDPDLLFPSQRLTPPTEKDLP